MIIGVNIDDDMIAILMFADDIALLVENESDLKKWWINLTLGMKNGNGYKWKENWSNALSAFMY